jgi:hypothetical protein
VPRCESRAGSPGRHMARAVTASPGPVAQPWHSYVLVGADDRATPPARGTRQTPAHRKRGLLRAPRSGARVTERTLAGCRPRRASARPWPAQRSCRPSTARQRRAVSSSSRASQYVHGSRHDPEDASQLDDRTSFTGDVASDGVHPHVDGRRRGRLATTRRVVAGLPHEVTLYASLGPSGGENPDDAAIPSGPLMAVEPDTRSAAPAGCTTGAVL